MLLQFLCPTYKASHQSGLARHDDHTFHSQSHLSLVVTSGDVSRIGQSNLQFRSVWDVRVRESRVWRSIRDGFVICSGERGLWNAHSHSKSKGRSKGKRRGKAKEFEEWSEENKCGEEAYYTLYGNGTLRIYGTGEMYNYWYAPASSHPPWYDNWSRISAVYIEDGITSLGNYALYNCYNIKTSITLPSTLERIGEAAFEGCQKISGHIAIPGNVKAIGSSAFCHCKELTSAFIPKSVTSIFWNPFYDCLKLANITVDPDNEKFWIENDMLRSDTTLIACICSKTGPLFVPTGLTTIGPNAFAFCCNLSGNITIPGNINTIGVGAFSECTGLSGNLTISDGVQMINQYAFGGCSGLQLVSIPKSVTAVGHNPFLRCTNLTSIEVETTNVGGYSSEDGMLRSSTTLIACPCMKEGPISIPSGITTIGTYAFAYCSLDGPLAIPSGVAIIKDNAFVGCSRLNGPLSISGTVTSIGADAFKLCSSLTSVQYLGLSNPGETDAFGSIPKLKKICVLPEYESQTFCGKPARKCIKYSRDFSLIWIRKPLLVIIIILSSVALLFQAWT